VVGPVGTWMGDCLWADKPSRCEASQLGLTQPSTLHGMVKLVSGFGLSSNKWWWWV